MESPSHVPLPIKFSSRSDPARASETASLAVHCRAQQRHAAGQCACVRLLPQARSPHAERSRLSLRYRERHINRQRPSRSRRSMAASDKRRSCAQRLSEQHLARHLSRRRFQSRPADARTARRMRGTHSFSARPLRQNRERHDTGEATPRHQPTALAHGLSGRRFSLFVVPQVLRG